MFEQFTKAFQDAASNPFLRPAQEAGAKAQQQFAKAVSGATEYAQLEISHALAIAQSRKPEEAIEAIAKIVKARQEFVARKAKEAFDEVSALSAEVAKVGAGKSTEFSQRARGAMEAAFANAKQGLDLAQCAAKRVVEKVA